MSRGVRALLAVPALVLGLAACGTPTLTTDTLEKAAEDAFREKFGQGLDVACPDTLRAEVGATTRCTLSPEGLDQEYGITVTVRSVEGGTTHFDVALDSKPQG